MAGSLKNLSALLSPRFRSPLTSTKNILGAPKSDGKLHYHQINRSSIAKKLIFSPYKESLPKFTKDVLPTVNILPDIKIEKAPDRESHIDHLNNLEETQTFSTNAGKTLDIDTPNKLDLAKNGLENLKNHTWVLGKGAFGTVFKGKHRGQIVAVKIISKEHSLREENALYLNHENIVRTLEIIWNLEYQNYCLIVMEYLPNCKNLQDVLEGSPVEYFDSINDSSELTKKFCLGITSGLDYCHSNGILHLDLKPRNILVNSESVCKICDFGNSVKIVENMDYFKHYGTIVYTAPEILLGKKPSTKSDIYSLGLIFWQIKYRKNPFQCYDSIESIIYNVGKHNVRPIYENTTPDILTQIFTKCWQSNPDSRPSTVKILNDFKEANF